MVSRDLSALAGIQYAGSGGSARDCQTAVMRFVQFGDHIAKAYILTAGSRHGLLLQSLGGSLTGIKPGLSSGYGGTGPSALSCCLQILEAHGADIAEYRVSDEFLERLEKSALARADIELIEGASPEMPPPWHDYILERDQLRDSVEMLWRDFPPVIPYGIVDPRLTDVAISFWLDPDARLMTGYRRLEGIVRERTGLQLHGNRLFVQSFSGTTPVLQWVDALEGEGTARANLFIAAFGAHRNPRAHREQRLALGGALSELLLLNHLYLLERSAVPSSPGR